MIGLTNGIGRFKTAGVALLVLAAAAAPLVTPAGGSSQRRDALPTLLPGTLTVALDIGTIGLAEGAIVNGEVVRARGFEIDLARALARKLGVELRLVDVPFARVVRPGSKPTTSPSRTSRSRRSGQGRSTSLSRTSSSTRACCWRPGSRLRPRSLT